jgi:hypothetical protein
MRLGKPVFVISICVLFLSVFAFAGQNAMGISDVYKVTFQEKTIVADTVLPAGDYQIRHVMEGATHIMVFRELGVGKPVEVRAKCTLVPLAEKARNTKKTYVLNAANERVLQELIFKGDSAKHVF